jgi:hypothetical protein
VAQAVAHGGEPADGVVQLLRFSDEHLPIDARLAIGRKHAGDLLQREAGGAPEPNQRQALQHDGIEDAAQAPPADRGDEPALLIIPQGRRGEAGAKGYFADVDVFHA